MEILESPPHQVLDLLLVDLDLDGGQPELDKSAERRELIEKIAAACGGALETLRGGSGSVRSGFRAGERESGSSEALIQTRVQQARVPSGTSAAGARRLIQRQLREQGFKPLRTVIFDSTPSFSAPDLQHWDGAPVLVTHGLLRLLSEPGLKRPVWGGLQTLFSESVDGLSKRSQ
jgi:hypothetical protein